MATVAVKGSVKELEQKLIGYVKANKWMSRESVLKGLKEGPIKQEYNVTDAQIEDIVNNTLWPGESRKGDVIYTKRKGGSAYNRVGKEYPAYAVRPVNDTYSIIRYDEGDVKDRFGRHEETVIIKNVPQKWAEQYVLNKLDPSLPKPVKLVGRELMKFGKVKARVASTMASLLTEGKPTMGFSGKELESRPVLLYEGQSNDVVTDGYLLIHDKDVADNVLGKHIERLRKSQYEINKKLGVSDKEAKEGADKFIEARRGGTFPAWDKLIPETTDAKWEPAGTSLLGEGTQVAWLYDGEHYIAVDIDKLAFIYSQVEGIDTIKSGKFSKGWDKSASTIIHTGPLVFYKGGKVKALLMPMFAQSVPEVITQSASKPTMRKEAPRIEKAIVTPEVTPPVTEAGMPKAKVKPSMTLFDLRKISKSRSLQAQALDLSRKHQVTISPRDRVRVLKWAKDQGSADIIGVDNPPSVTKPTKLPLTGRTRITPKRPRIT